MTSSFAFRGVPRLALRHSHGMFRAGISLRSNHLTPDAPSCHHRRYPSPFYLVKREFASENGHSFFCLDSFFIPPTAFIPVGRDGMGQLFRLRHSFSVW